MLHQIGDGEYRCEFFYEKEETSEDIILVLEEDKLWLKKEKDGFSLPRRRDFPDGILRPKTAGTFFPSTAPLFSFRNLYKTDPSPFR